MTAIPAPPPGTDRLGLIAGGGQFPYEVVRAANQRGRPVYCARIRREVVPPRAGGVDAVQRSGL
ncbi:MAG: hypothetical protein AAF628_32030, partial [Planctomycetota bacterium]